jgi:siderophore synthetase component
MNTLTIGSADPGTAHLNPDSWAQVNRLHAAKILRELAHEKLIELVPDGAEQFVLHCADGRTSYHFRARVRQLEHWSIDPHSIERRRGERSEPPDSLTLVLDVRERLGLSSDALGDYLEELASTLYGAAHKHVHQRWSAKELASAPFQEVEAAMSEGHPVFLANNGRVGFDVKDYRLYTPEVAHPVQLQWIAVQREHATFACLASGSYASLLADELGEARLASFAQVLSRQGLSGDDYLLMPVHPWQWENRIALVFAHEIALRRIVPVGASEDAYTAQQSIRTLANRTRPQRCYVKMSLSIRNMGFVRGLSPEYMENTPAINDWVHDLVTGDPELRSLGFGILREVASIGYRDTHFRASLERSSPYRKLLAALWRESPLAQLRPGERLITMTSLLHRDRDGAALLPELIRRSGLAPRAWLRAYLRCYLRPLLHCFYHHDLVFMPHGENLILVLRDDVPVRVLMKDIAEEINLFGDGAALPPAVRRIAVEVPEPMKLLSIFTDVFDCFFRYLAEVLEDGAGLAEQTFWSEVARCALEYQRAHPELRAKFTRYDLFAPDFLRSCLNRLQLGNQRQMVDLSDPAKALRFAGTLDNPLAALRTLPLDGEENR